MRDHGLLVGDVDRDGERTARAVSRDELGGDLLGAVGVQVGDDDVRAALASSRAVARPIPLAPPVTTATRPASSPRGGAWASL